MSFMKARSKFSLLLAAGLLLGSLTLRAQAPAQGSIRLINVTGLPQPTAFTIDGAKIKKDGFTDGFASGLVGILAGAHTISATYAAGGTVQQTVNVTPSGSVSVFAYSKVAVDPVTKAPTRTLALGVRENQIGVKGKRVYVLNACDKALPLSLNGQVRNVDPLKETGIDGFQGTELAVEVAGKSVGKFAIEEKGNYLIVIYQDAKTSELKAAYAPDFG
ncbi:MAG: hypothetical protein JSR82_15995 [Verrucomicrobia bacterium]|nr:hypothetical protein [Verrucomicrobiota bacterium]